jgi:hypothetical protein
MGKEKSYNVALSVMDRLSLVAMLPQSGSSKTMEQCIEITEMLQISYEESVEYGLRAEGEGKIYAEKKEVFTDTNPYSLTSDNLNLLRKCYLELDEKEELTPELVKLFKKGEMKVAFDVLEEENEETEMSSRKLRAAK